MEHYSPQGVTSNTWTVISIEQVPCLCWRSKYCSELFAQLPLLTPSVVQYPRSASRTCCRVPLIPLCAAMFNGSVTGRLGVVVNRPRLWYTIAPMFYFLESEG